MKKLYCYVDETGLDTEGRFFLVAIVLVEQQQQEIIEEKLKELERTTRKGNYKWTRAAFDRKERYIMRLDSIRELKASIFYSIYRNTKEYIALTSLTIAKAVLSAVARIEEEYAVTVVIDGLSKADVQKVSAQLKRLNIHYAHIRGLADEQSAFLRLADSIAGFLRDCQEQKSYTALLLKHLQQARLLIEA